jgi:hypothetical protein
MTRMLRTIIDHLQIARRERYREGGMQPLLSGHSVKSPSGDPSTTHLLTAATDTKSRMLNWLRAYTNRRTSFVR